MKHAGEYFRLTKLPMPPSSNNQYFPRILPGRAGGQMARLVPTGDLTKYQKSVTERWKNENLTAVYKCRATLREWMLHQQMIEITIFACFGYFDLFTQEGIPKRMDASNRVKALNDCLSEILEIDDCWFWRVNIVKCETKAEKPWCAVEFRPIEHQSISEMKTKGVI